MKKEFDVLLLGYYGFGNLGDELLCEASLRLLASCGVPKERVALLSAVPKERVALLSAAPRESEERYGVRAFDRWSLREIGRACAASRSLLLGGGGLFQDSTSARSCVYYYAAVRIARLLGLRVWAEGQSVGPLRRGLSRTLTRWAFGSCVHTGVRDESSRDILGSMGIGAALAPDLVTSLPVPRAEGGGGFLLFNARPGYRALAERAAAGCMKLAESSGLEVAGALSREDEAELASLASAGLIKLSGVTLVSSKEDFSRAARRSCGAVGMRLHFLILSALSGLPLAGCAYDPKVAGLCMRYNIALTDGGKTTLSAPPSAELAAEEAASVAEVFAEGLRAARCETNGR